MVRDGEPQQPMIEVTGWRTSSPEEILESGPANRRRPRRPVLGVSIVLALVGWLAVRSQDMSHPSGVNRTSASPRPARPHSPSPAITAAFATHVPGSIVISEHTVKELVRGDLVVARRFVNAVTGNVVMRVRIGRADAGHVMNRSARQIARHGYLIDFSFVGFYPPPRAQLRALADDMRLTAVSS